MKLVQQQNLRFDKYLSPQNKRPLNQHMIGNSSGRQGASPSLIARSQERYRNNQEKPSAESSGINYIQNTIDYAKSLSPVKNHNTTPNSGTASKIINERAAANVSLPASPAQHSQQPASPANPIMHTPMLSAISGHPTPTVAPIFIAPIVAPMPPRQASTIQSSSVKPLQDNQQTANTFKQGAVVRVPMSPNVERKVQGKDVVHEEPGEEPNSADTQQMMMRYRAQNNSVAKEQNQFRTHGASSPTGSVQMSARMSPYSIPQAVPSPLLSNNIGKSADLRNNDQLSTTVRPPPLAPIGQNMVSKKMSQMQTNISTRNNNIKYRRIEVQVAEQPKQELSLHTESLQQTNYGKFGINKTPVSGQNIQQFNTLQPPAQRIQVMRALSPPNSNDIIIENSYTNSSYDTKMHKLSILVSPEGTNDSLQQQRTPAGFLAGQRGATDSKVKQKPISIIQKQFETPIRNGEYQPTKVYSPVHQKHIKKQQNSNEGSLQPEEKKSGFSEFRNRFDQKDFLKQIDKQIGKQDIRSPTQRFLSPLADGGSSFDRRKKQRRLYTQKNSLDQSQFQSLTDREANALGQQQHLQQQELLNLLNHNLSLIGQTVKHHQEQLQQLSPNRGGLSPNRSGAAKQQQQSILQSSQDLDQNKNQIFWDEQAIKARNMQMALDQSKEGIQNTLTMKKMDIRGPDLFEHKLKMGQLLPSSVNFDVTTLKNQNHYHDLVDISKIGPSALLGFINLKQYRNSRKRHAHSLAKKQSKMDLNKDIELLQTGKINRRAGPHNIKVQLSLKAKQQPQHMHQPQSLLVHRLASETSFKGDIAAETVQIQGQDSQDRPEGERSMQDVPRVNDQGSQMNPFLNSLRLSSDASILVNDNTPNYAPKPIEMSDIVKQMNKDKITKIKLVSGKSQLRSKAQVQRIIENFSNSMGANQQLKNNQRNVEELAKERRFGENKKLSKILTDKLVLKDSFQNQRPFRNQWAANQKDPDIYDSELNVSMAEEGDKVHETNNNKQNSQSFLVKITNKPPAQMNQQNALKQEQDLSILRAKRKPMVDVRNNIQIGSVNLNGPGSKSNQFDTQYAYNSQHEQSGQTLKHQFMDETNLELDWDKMNSDFLLNNYEAGGASLDGQVIWHKIKVTDQNNQQQFKSNNLQYQHQMKLKQQSTPEGAPKNARLVPGGANPGKAIPGSPNFKKPVLVGSPKKYINQQILNQNLSNLAQQKNQLQGQSVVQARILGTHVDESKRELQDIITVGNIRLSKQVRINTEIPSEVTSPLSGAYGPQDMQNFQLRPMGLPSPGIADSRTATEGTPSPRKHHHLSLDPLRQASPINMSKLEDATAYRDMVPFQNNQLREQLREQRSGEFLINRGQSILQQRSILNGRSQDAPTISRAASKNQKSNANEIKPNFDRRSHSIVPARSEHLVQGNIARFREQHNQHLMNRQGSNHINIQGAHQKFGQASALQQQIVKKAAQRNMNQNHNANNAIHNQQQQQLFMTDQEFMEHAEKMQIFQQGNIINANHVAGPAVFRMNAPIQQRGVIRNAQEQSKQLNKIKVISRGGNPISGPYPSMVKSNVPRFAQYVHKRDSTKSLDEQEPSSFDPPILTKPEKKKMVRQQGIQKQNVNGGSFISMNISPFNTTHQNANVQGGNDTFFERDMSIMLKQTFERLDEEELTKSQKTPNKQIGNGGQNLMAPEIAGPQVIASAGKKSKRNRNTSSRRQMSVPKNRQLKFNLQRGQESKEAGDLLVDESFSGSVQ